MFEHNINPVFLDLGVVKIYYYGLVYALGFILIYILLRKQARDKKISLKLKDVDSYVIYLTLGLVIGARLGYALIYNLRYFFVNPLEIFMLWRGGMSFHGSMIGMVVANYLFAKKKKYHFYELADMIIIPLALALFFGRIANFINGELYGRITSVPWAVKFQGVQGYRHPSQLYEALKNLFIFGFLWKMKDKKLPRGIMFWTFVSLYGLLRFIIEFYRQPDFQIGNNGFFFLGLTMGQLLCIPMFFLGLYFIFRIYSKEMKKYD